MSEGKELIIESDSKNALAWVNRHESCPWNLRFFCNKLKNILSILNNVFFEHKNREVNGFADSLAKDGAQREGTWCVWT